jgi:hypothetical protein
MLEEGGPRRESNASTLVDAAGAADKKIEQPQLHSRSPKLWSRSHKILHISITSAGAFLVSWSASLYLSVAPAVAQEFGVNQTECEWCFLCSVVVITLSDALFPSPTAFHILHHCLGCWTAPSLALFRLLRQGECRFHLALYPIPLTLVCFLEMHLLLLDSPLDSLPHWSGFEQQSGCPHSHSLLCFLLWISTDRHGWRSCSGHL